MSKQKFLKEFEKEHREIRDILFDLLSAFIEKKKTDTQILLSKLNNITGPHFRYEEESLYPALITIYGQDYIDKLLTDHDFAIGRASRLEQLVNKNSTTDEENKEAINHVRSLLPHVSDCQGLSIMIEKLDNKTIDAIVSLKKEVTKENKPLLVWAHSIRKRAIMQF